MADVPTTPPHDALGVVSDALRRAEDTVTLAYRYLDPSLVDVLSILGLDKDYVTAQGCHIFDIDGRDYLDFHSGEGFSSLGHNHPAIKETLEAMLATDLLDGVQIQYSPLAGMLAESLISRLPDGLDSVYFANSGAEAVDAAMKFSRAATGRPRLLSTDGGYHGVTYGPLSIVGEDFFKEGFGPLLPGCGTIPWGDVARLEKELKKRNVAAFIVEPIQGLGVELPPDGYMEAAQELCRKYGTLFVLDEVQTGLGRTGKWFALEHWNLDPDFVLVAKALSGGYMPVSVVITRRKIYQQAVGTLERCYVQQSTYGRNKMSMAAGLAVMRVIERDGLVEHTAAMGQLLVDGLRDLQQGFPMIKEIRGHGLMIGVELQAPDSRIAKLNWRLIHLASDGLFPQLIVIPLHRDHGVITMASGKNDVIKLLPPMTITEPDIQRFLAAFEQVLADVAGPGGKNWGVVRDIATATLKRKMSRGDGSVVELPSRGTPVDLTRGEICLVTGASGFIGGHLVERLVRDGYQVRCLVRATSDTSRLEQLGVELAIGDLTNPRSLVRAAVGCTYVFHCGAMVSDWGTVEEIERINVTGTRELLKAAAEAGVVRFVHVSSTDIYGYPGRPVDETHTGNGFRNWYSDTKRRAEDEVRRAETETRLETVILRPATVWGPRSTEVVGEFATALKGGYMLLVGGGRANAGLVYVDNLLDAAVLALRSEHAAGEAFNLVDGLDVSWRQFLDRLAAGIGAKPPRLNLPYPVASGLGRGMEGGYRFLRERTNLTMPVLLSRQAVQIMGLEQDFNTTKARSVLGWTPRVGYDAGLEATLAWLREEYFAKH